jgi:hypothetical protein
MQRVPKVLLFLRISLQFSLPTTSWRSFSGCQSLYRVTCVTRIPGGSTSSSFFLGSLLIKRARYFPLITLFGLLKIPGVAALLLQRLCYMLSFTLFETGHAHYMSERFGLGAAIVFLFFLLLIPLQVFVPLATFSLSMLSSMRQRSVASAVVFWGA